VRFADGTSTPRIDVEFPAGHPIRSAEAAPIFRDKLQRSINGCFPPSQGEKILSIVEDRAKFEQTPINDLMDAISFR